MTILLDAGAMVALLDRSDRHHQRCARQLTLVREGFATTWPAIAEALARLRGASGGAAAVWELLERSQCRFLELGSGDHSRLRELTTGRDELSLAQASLVCVAERDGIDAIFSVDPHLSGRKRGRRRLFRRTLGGSAPSPGRVRDYEAAMEHFLASRPRALREVGEPYSRRADLYDRPIRVR